MAALGFEANLATVMSDKVKEFRILHFATHAIVDNRRPELSGLVLSLVDSAGRPQSGFLGIEDIYNMSLPVDLVVLSACDTALGKDIPGEGLTGLTHAFLYAGASRVLASLWEVEDRATAELMGWFYAGMEQKSMTPAAALRSAQIKMWQQPRRRAPSYWASFEIQGEY
jgi:CHAT domain-containing protein